MTDIRSATLADAPHIAAVWEQAWHDGHDGLVPDELLPHRTAASFLSRTEDAIGRTRVAEVAGVIAGFTMIHDDEVAQVFVDRAFRGTGIAAALLRDAVALLRAQGHAHPWLAVATGNARARRFYEREGWADSGPLDYAADIGEGRTIPVPTRRYVLVDSTPGMHPVVAEALARTPVIDGHNDLAWASREDADAPYSVEGLGGDAPHGRFHTDIPRLRAGGVGAQFWSVYVPVELAGADAVTATLEQIDFVQRLVARYPDDLVLARTGEDVRRAWAGGRIASLIGAEGGHSIDGSLAVLREFARLGVRYLTLTHSTNTPWADSATDEPEHGGLTEFGREVVREMNRIGMLVDLSHVSADTMRDALDTTSAPVIFSHSSCRAECAHPRNVPDDILRRLPDNGGVVMISFPPMFLSDEYAAWYAAGGVGPTPVVTIDDAVRHIEHARDVAGIAHIGLGGDYDGFEDFPEGMADVTAYPRLLTRLAERGWSATDLARLTGGNILRVLDEA